jgi:hypothetical protein
MGAIGLPTPDTFGISGNNFMSNAWRADSEATLGRAGVRILLGFLGRMSGNAFQEFWPSVVGRFHKNKSSTVPADGKH